MGLSFQCSQRRHTRADAMLLTSPGKGFLTPRTGGWHSPFLFFHVQKQSVCKRQPNDRFLLPLDKEPLFRGKYHLPQTLPAIDTGVIHTRDVAGQVYLNVDVATSLSLRRATGPGWCMGTALGEQGQASIPPSSRVQPDQFPARRGTRARLALQEPQGAGGKAASIPG